VSAARVVVMTKDPVPGRVKTRTIPLLGADGAAALHRLLVEQTLQTCIASGLPVVVALDGDVDALAARLAGRGIPVVAQGSGDLGARLRHVLRGPGRHVCVGTDCPALRPDHLRQAAAGSGITLGPALDGGYWLVAIDGGPADLPVAAHAIFHDIAWSTDGVLAQTLRRAADAGLPVHQLPMLRDLDTPADLTEYASDPSCPAALRAFLDATL